MTTRRTVDRPWRPSDPPRVSHSEWGKPTGGAGAFERAQRRLNELLATDQPTRAVIQELRAEFERCRQDVVARDAVNRQLTQIAQEQRARYDRLARVAEHLVANIPTSDWLALGNYVQMPLALLEQLRRTLVEEKQG